jgi:hypothetical protein
VPDTIITADTTTLAVVLIIVTDNYQCATLITTAVTSILQQFALHFKVSGTVLSKIYNG